MLDGFQTPGKQQHLANFLGQWQDPGQNAMSTLLQCQNITLGLRANFVKCERGHILSSLS